MYKLKLQAGAGSPGMRYRNPIWPSVSVHSARQSESASVPDASTACSECSQLRLSWSRRPYVLPIHIRNCLANSIHCMGQNLKSVSAYVCVCVCVCVCNCACVCTSLWGRISVHLGTPRKRSEMEAWFLWTASGKWHKAYGESNGHVHDRRRRVVWSWKVKVVTPIYLGQSRKRRDIGYNGARKGNSTRSQVVTWSMTSHNLVKWSAGKFTYPPITSCKCKWSWWVNGSVTTVHCS